MIKGHIDKFWDDSYKTLPFVKQPVTDEEVNAWQSQGYDCIKSFTGSMYDSRNPMPEWVDDLKKFFPYKDLTFTFYRMSTLEIMPTHVDHYRTYCKLFNVKYENVNRILLMLEDWKPGHYLEIEGEGIVNWKAGDYFIWESDAPHAASNIGIDDRYTLQITATRIVEDKVWRNLHWYNIPDLATKVESTTNYFLNRIRTAVNSTNPWYVYLYNQNIKDLETIKHSPSAIEYLNTVGVDIYLFEPLCSYVEGATLLYPPNGTKHTMWFYSEFIGNEDPITLRSDELDSILLYAENNNLTNVRVHTCEYDTSINYPFYAKKLQLLDDDLFLKTVFPLSIKDESMSTMFSKRFICLNWRYTSHRNLIAAYVSTKSSYCGWYHKGDASILSKDVWYDVNTWQDKKEAILEGFEYHNKHSPLTVDVNVTEAIEIKDKYFMDYWPKQDEYPPGTTPSNTNFQTNSLEKYYRDVFCDIITETRFAQPTGNYSEKVYQAMYYKKPFILCAPPNTLKHLKEHGFKTFSDFWDESYDEYTNHQERLLKIFDVIDFINDKSLNELREMYSKMVDILEHNRNLLDKKVMPL